MICWKLLRSLSIELSLGLVVVLWNALRGTLVRCQSVYRDWGEVQSQGKVRKNGPCASQIEGDQLSGKVCIQVSLSQVYFSHDVMNGFWLARGSFDCGKPQFRRTLPQSHHSRTWPGSRRLSSKTVWYVRFSKCCWGEAIVCSSGASHLLSNIWWRWPCRHDQDTNNTTRTGLVLYFLELQWVRDWGFESKNDSMIVRIAASNSISIL